MDTSLEPIQTLVEYLSKTVPAISFTHHGRNVFVAGAALLRCSRFLSAVLTLTSSGLGDASGGDLRIVCETWIFGHLLLLADDDELREMWGSSRSQAEKTINELGLNVDWPDSAPEAGRRIPIDQQAAKLTAKLRNGKDPDYKMPDLCYKYLYRSESLLSTHASTNSILAYANIDGTISLPAPVEPWRPVLGGVMVMYFAQKVFEAGGLDTTKLDALSNGLTPRKFFPGKL